MRVIRRVRMLASAAPARGSAGIAAWSSWTVGASSSSSTHGRRAGDEVETGEVEGAARFFGCAGCLRKALDRRRAATGEQLPGANRAIGRGSLSPRCRTRQQFDSDSAVHAQMDLRETLARLAVSGRPYDQPMALCLVGLPLRQQRAAAERAPEGITEVIGQRREAAIAVCRSLFAIARSA